MEIHIRKQQAGSYNGTRPGECPALALRRHCGHAGTIKSKGNKEDA